MLIMPLRGCEWATHGSRWGLVHASVLFFLPFPVERWRTNDSNDTFEVQPCKMGLAPGGCKVPRAKSPSQSGSNRQFNPSVFCSLLPYVFQPAGVLLDYAGAGHSSGGLSVEIFHYFSRLRSRGLFQIEKSQPHRRLLDRTPDVHPVLLLESPARAASCERRRSRQSGARATSGH